MDPFETIISRRSVRKFKPEPIGREPLWKLLDAGRMAPTARNEQPWDFIAVTEPAMLKKIAAATDNGKFIADAGACIVVTCKATKYYLEDGCAATTQLLCGAAAMGYGACWVAGDKKRYASRILKLCKAPEGHKLVSIIAVGIPDETPIPQKRSLDEVAHWEQYGGE